ncbi:arylformamidase [Shouchella shacheensis]|uniref:arylformamidase n=1 Tax=Shouchella shacheensis TaxID=1649580 RepID=UPI00073FC593|nr:arylformamidase [Shouchella shacheensis]
MAWIDITQPLNETIAHWPGDRAFSYTLEASKEETGSVNIGSVSMSLHTGTHIDAPFHFNSDGTQVHELSLKTYIGPARVIEALDAKVLNEDLFRRYSLSGVKRLLVKTKRQANAHLFPKVLPPVTEDGARYLSTLGVCLLGVDVPSVDEPESKTLDGHHALGRAGVAILENARLEHVEPGDYELIALPLLIEGADGSPVRAVLKSAGGGNEHGE